MMFSKSKLICLLLSALSTAASVIGEPSSDLAIRSEEQALEKRVPAGFVTRSGTKFTLDGQPFFFMGTNAYWASGLSSGDLNSLFSQMNSAGLKVLRIFAWSDNVGGPNNQNLQSWSGSTNTPNPSAFAAQMDPIVNAAASHNIKLVVPMIGNWGPSISLYIQQFLGSSATHDTFYSNTNIINAYKKYVSFFVNRYKSSSAIFAWELMNEPRCQGDDNRGQSSACNNALITKWVSTMSSYIKSIDPNHMVTVGDEGWFTPSQGYGSSYPYSGSIGIDWVANLKLSSIDYGTVHLYPEGWGQTLAWGNTWIQQHGAQGNSVGKPVVLEEFGTTNTGARYSTLQGWLSAATGGGLGGIQYWQFVASFPSGYKSPDDGNGISTSESSFALVKSTAQTQNSKSGSGGGGGTPSSTAGGGGTPTSTGSAPAATQTKYGQCGGQGWTGPTKCASGSTCQASSVYYSQCL